jgi:AraC-like DNA-binding protein
MSTVAAMWMRLIVEHAAGHGVDPGPALRAVGLDPARLPECEVRVDADLDDAIWARLVAALDDDELAVHVGAGATARHFGWLGFRTRACATLGDAAAVAHRLGTRPPDDHGTFAVGRRGRDWAVTTTQRRRFRREELRLVAVLALSRTWTGVPLVPLAVPLRDPRPARPAALADFFGCPITFDAAESALILPASVASLPLLTADPELAAHLDGLAPSDPADDLRAAITLALRSGEPTLPWVARRLGVSARTLQRRLRDQNTSFRAVVDDLRAAEAARLLSRGERLAAIAERLGFSEERSFRRAFHRWTGSAPTR